MVVIVLLPISTVFVSVFGDVGVGTSLSPQEVSRKTDRSMNDIFFI